VSVTVGRRSRAVQSQLAHRPRMEHPESRRATSLTRVSAPMLSCPFANGATPFDLVRSVTGLKPGRAAGVQASTPVRNSGGVASGAGGPLKR